jgi:hypothetical protein
MFEETDFLKQFLQICVITETCMNQPLVFHGQENLVTEQKNSDVPYFGIMVKRGT